MKKILLLVALVTTSLISCSESKNNEPIPEPNIEDEFITVSLKAGGELIGTESPLNRAETNSRALYGVQICISPDKIMDYSLETATKIAFGVFDDLKYAKVDLPKNKKYIIEVTYIPYGKDVIHYHTDKKCWEMPFNTFSWSASPLNEIQYSTSEYIYCLAMGANTPVGSGNNRGDSWHLEVDRYYGVLLGFEPTNDNNIATIDMKRTVFGLTFNAKKSIEKNYDKILIQLNADEHFLGGSGPKKYYLTMDANESVSQLVIPYICLWYPGLSVVDETYLEEIVVSIGTDERTDEIFYGTIKVKRNTMHTYDFDAVPQLLTKSGINVTIDPTPMQTEVGQFFN